MKSAIFFITGTSASGKSTIVDLLKSELPFVEVHDFDEGGVPDGADEAWRKVRTNEWLEKAISYRKEGKPTIVCGVSVPTEVKNAPLYSSDIPTYFGLIKVDDGEIRRRLSERGWDDELISNNIAWAHHLESYVVAEPSHCVVDGMQAPDNIAKEFASWVLGHLE